MYVITCWFTIVLLYGLYRSTRDVAYEDGLMLGYRTGYKKGALDTEDKLRRLYLPYQWHETPRMKGTK